MSGAIPPAPTGVARPDFPPALRVRRRADFDQAYREGYRKGGRFLQVTARKNGLDHARLGLAIGRRLGAAVVRNRWKRWIREAFRRHPQVRGMGLDLVVAGRPGSDPGFRDIERDLDHCLQSLRRRAEAR